MHSTPKVVLHFVLSYPYEAISNDTIKFIKMCFHPLRDGRCVHVTLKVFRILVYSYQFFKNETCALFNQTFNQVLMKAFLLLNWQKCLIWNVHDKDKRLIMKWTLTAKVLTLFKARFLFSYMMFRHHQEHFP